MSAHRPPSRPVDTGLFWRAVVISIIGGIVAALLGPLLVSALLRLPPGFEFPGGARFALVAAWGTLVLLWVAALNLRQIISGGSPVEFNTPPDITRWLRAAALGIAALELGFAISTTIFR